MEVFINGRTNLGVYVGTAKDGAHILKPAVFPGQKYTDEKAPVSERYKWEDAPSFNYGHIEGFRPVKRELLETAANFDQVSGLGKIYFDEV